MKPSGKCLEEFEKWLLIWIKDNVAWPTETPTQEDIDHFYSFPDAMKYGVYVDYFDSLGLIVHSGKSLSGYNYYVTNTPKHYQSWLSETRNTSRTVAIEKANEIRNRQLN